MSSILPAGEALPIGPCPICAGQAIAPPATTRTLDYDCERCGSYRLVWEAGASLKAISTEKRPKLSRWITDQNRLGMTPKLGEAELREALEVPDLTLRERAERLLLFMVDHTNNYGQRIMPFIYVKLHALLETYSDNEVGFIAKYMEELGWLKDDQMQSAHFQVTGKGFEKAEELKSKRIKSEQAFVAMWFDDALNDIYKSGLCLGITTAGYKPLRIDNAEHNNKICDQIIAEIRRSRFVVADFTGHRGGVYYEAGFASGFGLDVIYTCRRNDLQNLHFDVRQYNMIDWESAEELAERLGSRISATIGDGPLRQLAATHG